VLEATVTKAEIIELSIYFILSVGVGMNVSFATNNFFWGVAAFLFTLAIVLR
jgi:hypothetical protein